jgi:TPR repeat protein
MKAFLFIVLNIYCLAVFAQDVTISSLVKQAKNGNGVTQFELAQIFDEAGTPIDDKKARLWFEKSAKAGYAPAITEVALKYYYNVNSKKSQKKAFDLLLHAAQKDYPKAQYFLAQMYFDGIGTKSNFDLALNYAEKAAENQFVDAYVMVGDLNATDKIQNYNTAFEWYSKADKFQNKEAKLKLGELYEQGLGVKKDEAKAYELYVEATKLGNTVAFIKIASCFEKGIGVEKNSNEALNWYKYAARRGDVYAHYMLGEYYSNEERKDFQQAFNWYQKAAEKGLPIAQYKLGMMYLDYNGMVVNLSLGAYWLNLASYNGVVEATQYYANHRLDRFITEVNTMY